MRKISGILVQLMKQYGLEGKMIEYTLAEKWEDIAGNIIAAHSKPAGIRYRKLNIAVDSPVWLQELSFYKADIIKNVNNYFGKEIINDVFLKIG